MNTVFFKNLKLVDFKEAWDFQESLLNSIIDDKRNGRETKNYLIFVNLLRSFIQFIDNKEKI